MADTETYPLVTVTLVVCDHCLGSIGVECHTPGCAFWMHDVPANDTAGVLFNAAVLDPAPGDGGGSDA